MLIASQSNLGDHSLRSRFIITLRNHFHDHFPIILNLGIASKNHFNIVSQNRFTYRELFRITSGAIHNHAGRYSDSLRKLFKITAEAIQIHFGSYSDSLRKLFKITAAAIQIHFGTYSDSLRKLFRFTAEAIHNPFVGAGGAVTSHVGSHITDARQDRNIIAPPLIPSTTVIPPQ